MRKLLRRILPDRRTVAENRFLAPFRNTLLHPRLWHLNRRSAAGGVAIGLFCGLVPGPFQMLGAAVLALLTRSNLPLALVLTLYTNPFTIVPLYLLAFAIGSTLLGTSDAFVPPPPVPAEGLMHWLDHLELWMIERGPPLALGLVVLAIALAALGYALVRVLWRGYLLRSWHARKQRSGKVTTEKTGR